MDVLFGCLVLMLLDGYDLRSINRNECRINDSIELICDYKGDDIYESNGVLPIIKTITFPTFGDGEIFVSDKHFPDLSNVNIHQSLTMNLCKHIHTSNAVVTRVGTNECNTESKITILYGPNDTYKVEPGTSLNIGVDATTNLQFQNQMKFDWIMYDTRNTPDTVIMFLPPTDGSRLAQYFARSQAGKNLTIMIPTVRDDDGSYNDYNAVINHQYAANISNQYEVVILNFTISGKIMVIPIVKPRLEASASNLWIIGLILFIVFIEVILIACYVYRKRLGTCFKNVDMKSLAGPTYRESIGSGRINVDRPYVTSEEPVCVTSVNVLSGPSEEPPYVTSVDVFSGSSEEPLYVTSVDVLSGSSEEALCITSVEAYSGCSSEEAILKRNISGSVAVKRNGNSFSNVLMYLKSKSNPKTFEEPGVLSSSSDVVIPGSSEEALPASPEEALHGSPEEALLGSSVEAYSDWSSE